MTLSSEFCNLETVIRCPGFKTEGTIITWVCLLHKVCLLLPYYVSLLAVLKESHQWLLLAFCEQILRGCRALRMVLCHSMNAGLVVGTLISVGTLIPCML